MSPDSDRAIASALAGLAAVVSDFVMFGGDMLVSALTLVFTDPTSLLSFLSVLSTYASRVEWLPAGAVESAYNFLILVAVVVLAIGILERIYERAT
ncbi:hypothetical protein [Halopiger thermotolerans]